MDDKKLERGDEITPALLKAIEESKIAVIILGLTCTYTGMQTKAWTMRCTHFL
jgi:hypothetical protein